MPEDELAPAAVLAPEDVELLEDELAPAEVAPLLECEPEEAALEEAVLEAAVLEEAVEPEFPMDEPTVELLDPPPPLQAEARANAATESTCADNRTRLMFVLLDSGSAGRLPLAAHGGRLSTTGPRLGPFTTAVK